MKKIITVLILFVVMILLTACSYEGKSIDDCKNHGGKCYYNNESVKNDDSELSKGLFNLLLKADHDISFYYDIYPGEDILWIKYQTDEEISHNSFTEMISMHDEIIALVNSLYDIAVIEFTVSYMEDINMDILYDTDSELAVLFSFDEFVTENSSDLDDDELFNVASNYIDEFSDPIKICLDYDKTILVSIFNVSYKRIYLEVENDVITYRLPTRLDNESFESKLLEVFGEYNFVKYID